MDKILEAPTTHHTSRNAQILRYCERLEEVVRAQQKELVQAARELQSSYENDRERSTFPWQELILVIKATETLVIQWSRRRRIRRTKNGRRWWWDRMPYDAARKTYPIRHLIRGLSAEEANRIADVEATAQRLRERWAETTRFMMALRALRQAASQDRRPPPWVDPRGQRVTALPQPDFSGDHPDIAIDTFAGSLALMLHALRAELTRDARVLSVWAGQVRRTSPVRLRVNVRGNSLDIAWYAGASTPKRLAISARSQTALTTLARHAAPEDVWLVTETEEAARLLRTAWAHTTKLLLQTRSMRRRDDLWKVVSRKSEFATRRGHGIGEGHLRSPQ